MRNIIIGIIIGIVLGVMIGTTVVAPRLEQARLETGQQSSPSSEAPDIPGAENLDLPSQVKASVAQSPVTRLSVISMFPAKMPVLGELPQRLKRAMPSATAGRLGVTVYDPGTLVNAEDSLDAVASGTVDAMFAAPGEWAPDDPTLQLFTAIPFGPEAEEYLAWFYHGGGRELFQEALKKKGVHATLCGAIPPEASGWYRSPVRNVDDLKSLKIRAFGLGGEVLRKLGADVQHLDAGEVLSRFEQGELDGAEYSLPSVDAPLGFQQFARNYYFPGWHQPVTLFALGINSQTWDSLPASEQAAIQTVCGDNVRYALALADAQQFEALKELGLAGIQVRRWSDDILQALETAWKEVAREKVQSDKTFATVWGSLQKFRRDYAIWHEISRF